MRISFIALLVSITGIIYAQEKTIKGTVYYEDSKQTVPFAYVKINNIAYGTVTEYDGTFSLRIPEKYHDKELEFSYVGYKKLVIPIKSIKEKLNIYLKPEPVQLLTVVVTAKRNLNAVSIIKKALKSVDENYVNEEFNLSGFYREYIMENGSPVKYADASFLMDLKPYNGKKQKAKKFENAFAIQNSQTVAGYFSFSSSLHRTHFHHRTLKGEKVEIIESKSSDDLNKTRLYANIQGGPLSALAKDKVKYPTNFLTKYSKYKYKAVEVEKEGKGYYLVNFSPKMTPEDFKKKRRYNFIPYKLQGIILIEKDTYAITEIKYSVPPEYKNYICSYRGWAVRHFDYAVETVYEKFGEKYALSRVKHTDEFIVEDTVSNRRIPYTAISEIFVKGIESKEPKIVKKENNFANSNFNFFYDYPLEYNKEYWENYYSEHSEAEIPQFIRSGMETESPLEVQFTSKLIRDSTLTPPVAKKKSNSFKIHGKTLYDDYSWMKDRNPSSNQEVMDYLTKENAYTTNFFKPLRKIERDIFKEIKSYIISDYTSVSLKDNGYEYFYRYLPEKEYPIYYRKKIGAKKEEKEILFDVNELGKDKTYYNFTGLKVSPNNTIAGFAENTIGNDKWDLKFKDLKNDNILDHKIEYVGGYEWFNDSTIIYIKFDERTFKSSKVYSYNLNNKESKVLYKEKDPLYNVFIQKSRSKEFIFIVTSSKNENETYILPTSGSLVKPSLFSKRKSDVKYGITHFEDKFYVLTNEDAINGKVLSTDTSALEKQSWKIEIPHQEEVEITGIVPFKKWLVIGERQGLDHKIKVINKEEDKQYYVPQKKQSSLFLSTNTEFDTDTLQFSSRNFTKPTSIYSYNMGTKKKKLLKRTSKLSPVSFAIQEVVYATARDGEKIPITLLYNRGVLKRFKKEEKAPPLYIYGYGSYGSSNTPSYTPNISPLLYKGVVYAIAHVRGGGELGDKWYHDGRLLNKKNTFNDFIDCTEFLIEQGYGEKGKVIAQGGSAGGLLMGAVANERPDLYGLMILDVPFVDVINTMLDDKLPGTIEEYEEWGNPNEKKYFKYISSYSPYDNIKKQDYPMMLFTTGLFDSRVGYWEPAKMVAKLRQMNTSKNEILLKINLSGGHGGAAGRYNSLSDTAFRSALIFDYINRTIPAPTKK